MARINERLAKLEASADHADGKHNIRVFMLDEHDPLPDGVNPEDDDVLVVRLIAVDPVHDEDGNVIPLRPAAGARRD